jgi:threonyl-tRNA synthetase
MNTTSLEQKRHTLAHLLALSVRKEFPHALPTIGPAIENGFYYDFDFSAGEAPKDEDLKRLEKNMKKALSTWKAFSHRVVTPDEAREVFKGNQFKIELINDLEKNGETITLYTVGEGHSEFTDLCRGGHSESPATEIDVDSFKLNTLAGAYWRGDEKNPMLTRIYGLAFDSKDGLDTYLAQLEEAKKRDHRKLGAEMKLFTLSSLVGSGLPLLQPKGAIIRREIEEYLWELHKGKGYDRVWTPHIAKEVLYETSGHASKFGDELFRVSGKEENFILKPMNCPHHMQIFADNQFSYRDLPVRYFEPATVYRDEKTGQLAGLTRVRAITQDDGHLFCRVSQINDEVTTIVGIIREFYKTMNLLDGYWVRLSVRGEGGMYIGEDEVWEKAEAALENAAKLRELPYTRVEGEAAFYGPKLDFMFKDAIGREWQLATIQCDFNLPERFNLSFINEKGEKERPVVIHRAISGSLERFMGVMIEHFGGNFPLWLSPEQVRVIPVSDVHNAYARQVTDELKAIGVRVVLDDDNDSMGKKIRNAKKDRLPYFVVVGDKEVAEKTVTLESRDGTSTNMSHSALGNHLLTEIETRVL